MSTINRTETLTTIEAIRILTNYPVKSVLSIKVGNVKYIGSVGSIITDICQVMNIYSNTKHTVNISYKTIGNRYERSSY